MKTIKESMSEEFDKKIPQTDYQMSYWQQIKYKIWWSYINFIRKLGA